MHKRVVLPFMTMTLAAMYLGTGLVAAEAIAKSDGKPADMTKPVQVFLVMGQSNGIGFGNVKQLEGNKKYPYLVDDAGGWVERKDVRNVRVMGVKNTMKVFYNEWLSLKGQSKIGVDIAAGYVLGNAVDAPVLILKSCIGNRALAWDLLPPGSERVEYNGKILAGYKDFKSSWAKGEEAPTSGGWYAGKQYDEDTQNAKTVLADLGKYYPGATKYEVAGFFFWQGEKDAGNGDWAAHYEKNLVQFIKQLRKDFNAPNSKFVAGTLGEHAKGSNNGVFNGHMAVDGTSGKYPEFKGNVATVLTNPMAQGGSGNAHYGGKAEVYMDVGEAMGQAMVKMLKN